MIKNKGTHISIDKRFSKVLEWPSYSVSIKKAENYSDNKFEVATGTNTANQEANYITLLSISISDEAQEIVIKRKYKHQGNVMNILSINDSYLISASSNNNLYLYNLNQDCPEVSTKPDLMFKSYTSPCTGLSIGLNKNVLLSSSEKGEVTLWDIKYDSNLGVIEPMYSSSYHNGKVNDVAWNMGNEFLYSSCGEDKRLNFYDMRERDKHLSVLTSSSVKKISFNNVNQNLFLSGSGMNIIDLWDLRNTKIKLHTFQYHTNSITGIKWSDTNENLFISTGLDGNMVMWNLQLLGEKINPVISEEVPAEAEVIHKKQSKIYNFDWKRNTITLVDNQNNIEIVSIKSK